MSNNFEDRKKILREKAEKKISKTDPDIDDFSRDQLKALIQDYQLYQVELEVQNDELREVQNKLQQTRDRFAKLYNKAPFGYVTVDHNGIVIQTNQTLADMAGKNPDQISGKAMAELIVPEDRSSFHGRFRAFFKNPYNKQMDFRLSSSQDSLWVRCTGRIEDDVQHCSF
ncbi:MAG: PAS domain S-box protein, partial [Desulfonatronovibrio sp.]